MNYKQKTIVAFVKKISIQLFLVEKIYCGNYVAQYTYGVGHGQPAKELYLVQPLLNGIKTRYFEGNYGSMQISVWHFAKEHIEAGNEYLRLFHYQIGIQVIQQLNG